MQTQGGCWEIGRGGHSWDVRCCCFLGRTRPCGSHPQGSRASICVAHGRHGLYFSPENPQSTKVQMDVEGLGANSSLGGCAVPGVQSPSSHSLPSLADLTDRNRCASREKHAKRREKWTSALLVWMRCFHNPTSLT